MSLGAHIFYLKWQMIEDYSTMITKKEAFLHMKIAQQLQQQIFRI